MDHNSALVDAFLTRKASPPAPASYGSNKRGVHTPTSNANNAHNHSGPPIMDANAIKRVFQLQQRLTVLVPEVGHIIKELEAYNMFPRMSNTNDDDDANQQAAAILVTLLQQSNAGDNGQSAITYNSNSNSNSNVAGVQSWDVGARGGNNTNTTNTTDFMGNNSDVNASSNNVMNVRDAAALAAAAHDLGGSDAMAFVEFKRSRYRKFICNDPAIEPGSYVLVDGDRGTDCGLLVQMVRRLPDGQTSVVCMDGCDIMDEKVKLESGRVIREATEEEVDRLHSTIASAEAVALKTCRQRCQELGIEIDLLDVEYQFDMKKIAFYFDCDHSVDFRSLVRELYRTFGARIWMENVNPKVKNAMPDREGGGGGGGGGEFSHHHGGGGGNSSNHHNNRGGYGNSSNEDGGSGGGPYGGRGRGGGYGRGRRF